MLKHQYIDRFTGRIKNERLVGDRLIRLLYDGLRENTPAVFKALTSARGSRLVSYFNFEPILGLRLQSARRLMASWGVDLSECLEDPARLDTPAKIFTRKIRYWDCRPMPEDPLIVVSPADARILLGSLKETSLLHIKGKFFDDHELLGLNKPAWLAAFQDGDFAVFRLTPDKYHYTHTPAAGRVLDFYELNGDYHSCNPSAVVSLITPYSKNKRAVTILVTDVLGGAGLGLLAMVEVAALMVGGIIDCYSREKYDDPQPVRPGMFLEKGRPKSLFQPGSSTVVLLFQAGRVVWDKDLVENQHLAGVSSRFSQGFGRPLVETEVRVRSGIGRVAARPQPS
ncbi:MAG: phosphatidylserine decarboxylase [Pseudomonadota bacterium]